MLEFNKVSLYSREQMEQSLRQWQVFEPLPKRTNKCLLVAIPGKVCLRVSKKARDIYLLEIAF